MKAGRSRHFEEVAVGEELPELALPLTRTVIVAGAIASRDYQDVHHDAELARARGSEDVFMNILTTNGLVGRYVTDWAGPQAMLRRVAIRLGAPNYPGDTMVLSGTVTEAGAPEAGAPEAGAPEAGSDGRDAHGRGLVTVAIRGANSRGVHVSGTVELSLPRQGAAS